MGSFPAGTSMTIGSLTPGTAGLAFRASDALQSPSASDPARIEMCVTVSASDPAGFAQILCFSLLADLDVVGGGGDFVPGPDGVAGTADDGVIAENFDTDRDGDGVLSLGARPGAPGAPNDTIGVWVGNDPGGLEPIAVVACGGFLVPPQDPPDRSGLRHGLAPALPVTWRTSSECDLSGFNVIVRDAHDRRIQLNNVLIPCEACITGEGRSYSFPIPKHRSGRNVFLEVLHRDGVIRTVGPALRL